MVLFCPKIFISGQDLLAGLQLGVRLSLMARTTMENMQARKNNNNDGRRWFERHRKSRQEERADGEQISGVRSECEDRPSLDPGERARP
jgi:hypothetical protein